MFNLDIKVNDNARVVLIIVATLLSLSIGNVVSKWDGHFFPQENCWKVQEVNGQFFKVNTCSGEIEEIKVNIQMNATSKK